MAKKKSDATGSKAESGGTPARRSWLDDDSGEPMIQVYTKRLQTFLDAMADGKVDAKELDAQEKRLAKLLKKVEAKLDDDLHHDVTELLCELSAYNIMHTVFGIAEAAPKARFQG